MSRLRFLIPAVLLFLTQAIQATPDAADAAMATIHADAIRAEMRFLSDDSLEGRGTGQRGYDIAAKFMAAQFESLGLKPAGDDGTYFQNVPLRSLKVDESKSSLSILRSGKEETLVSRSDYILSPDAARSHVSVEAPVVFVGYGITAPSQNYDDYKGIDVKGKIIAYIFGAPNFESSLKAHYSSSTVKAQNAVVHGAVGAILLMTPKFEKMSPFKKRVRDIPIPRYRWLDKEGKPNDYFQQLKSGMILSLNAVSKLFEGAPHSADEVFKMETESKPASFELPLKVKVETATDASEIRSTNIAATLEGSDPKLKSEYVVYTAHLDHLGIAEPVKGDKIYNGALDNASGCAIILEIARAFTRMSAHPRRSLMFVAVTAEEAGLLGSDYFAHYPTVPKSSIAANVNIDQDLMLWPLQDLVAFGAEHTSLSEVVKTAAARMKLKLSPDPLPQEVIFIRSDQYSFVKQGIPAVMPSPGFGSSDPKIKPFEILGEWEETRYHQPQDDMDQPGLNFEAATKFARFGFLCGYLIAQTPQRPTWNKGDFFGDLYGKAH